MKAKVRIASIILSVAAAGTLLPAGNAEAGGRNYGRAWETALVRWNGYVQIQASYNDGDRHARRGYHRFTRQAGPALDTGRMYTSSASSSRDTSVRSRTDWVWDSVLIGDKYTTRYNYGFEYF